MDETVSRYEFVPKILKRLFTWGMLWSSLFFGMWYFGGMHGWAVFITFLAKLFTLFQIPISYNFDQGAIVFMVKVGMAPPVEVGYFANQWNLGMAEVVLLLSLWWSKNKEKKTSMLVLCFLVLAAYQLLAVGLHICNQAMGPDLPNRLGVMWDYEGNFIYLVLRKAQLFDTFIGRYWVGFPVFSIAWLYHFSILQKSSKKKGKIKKRS